MQSGSLKALCVGYLPAAAGGMVYTVGASKQVIVKEIWVANTDAAVRNITVRFVPNGQATSDAYNLLPITLQPKGQPGCVQVIPCNTFLDTPGDFVDVFADVASKCPIRISGIIAN